eukprot:547203-Pleurochrysis_carterae.AAC.4
MLAAERRGSLVLRSGLRLVVARAASRQCLVHRGHVNVPSSGLLRSVFKSACSFGSGRTEVIGCAF